MVDALTNSLVSRHYALPVGSAIADNPVVIVDVSDLAQFKMIFSSTVPASSASRGVVFTFEGDESYTTFGQVSDSNKGFRGWVDGAQFQANVWFDLATYPTKRAVINVVNTNDPSSGGTTEHLVIMGLKRKEGVRSV